MKSLSLASSALMLSLVMGAGWVPVAIAEAPPPPAVALDRANLEKRLESVKSLLEKSSAAKQIEASNEPSAIAGRAKALDLWQQAKVAFDQGDLALTQKLLIEAPKAMFAAARLAAPEQLLADKAKSDYLNRKESVKALLVAQRRIADEKGNTASATKSAGEIDGLLTEADRLASEGRYEQARTIVDQAYLIAKASVGSMRSGDTLVRSLNFATKEEEYKYELDRNDTHMMLIKVLVEQKSARTPTVDAFVNKAAVLRQQAESTAAKSDFQSAIKELEESTGELVKAIRSAGIYIPS